MLHLPEIWDCLKKHLPKDRWLSLSEIYDLIENFLPLDSEDLEQQSPTSNIPKWKRNVRNVLQYRKKTGDIEWNGHCGYKMRL